MIHRRSTIPRKRKKSIIPWRRDVDKYRRCQPQGPPQPPSCNHSCIKFQCAFLGKNEMEAFHRKFYYTRNKAQQDAFLLRHCQGRSPKRKSSVALKERKLTVEYYVPARERKVQVCKEAFIGILRVTKSRVNALLKSFYKVDFSKDNSQDEQSSSREKRKCRERRRNEGENINTFGACKSKSLANMEHSAQKKFSVKYRCQSENGTNLGYSISFMENNIQEETTTRNGNETDSVNEENLYDWLKKDSKPRRNRTFDWSPLKQAGIMPTKVHFAEEKMSNSSLAEVHSEPLHKSLLDDITANSNTVCNEVIEPNSCTKANPRVSLFNQSHVYESKKRKLRKIQIIDEKENVYKKGIIRETNSNDSNQEQKIRCILNEKKITKSELVKSKGNSYLLKRRLPLRTLC